MQIVISPVSSDLDNIILDVDPLTTVDSLKALCGEKLNIEPDLIKLVFDDVELKQGSSTLREHNIKSLSSVRLIVSENTSETSEKSDSILSDQEVNRAILITNIPKSDDEDLIESTVYSKFSTYGSISRLILQDADSESSNKHALIVFGSSTSALSSLAADGSELLGSTIHVILATNLVTTASKSPSAVANALSDLLAKGYLAGVKGVAYVRDVDEKNVNVGRKIKVASETVKNAAGEFNQKYKITETLQQGLASAKSQTAQINAKYHISERVSSATETVNMAAKSAFLSLNEKIAQNPTLSNAAQKTKVFVANAVDQVKADMSFIEERLQSASHSSSASSTSPTHTI